MATLIETRAWSTFRSSRIRNQRHMGAVPYQNDVAHSAWEAGLQSNIKMLKISGSPSNPHQSCASFQAGGYARISD
jgi:hypothetical protein